MKSRVAIVGGGFGGLTLAKQLAHRVNAQQTEIVLIDRSPFHTLKPKLPQAVGGRIPCAVQVPITQAIRGTPIRFLQQEVVEIHPKRGEVAFADEILSADYIVVAAGCRAHTPQEFQSDAAPLPVWSFDQACQLRRRIGFLSKAAAAGKPVDLNVAVVGGGFVGVELAAELQHRYNRLGLNKLGAHVTLIEAAARLLPRLEEAAGERTLRRLDTLGVITRLQRTAMKADGEGVYLDDGTVVECGTVVGAMGVEPLPFLAESEGLADATGRIPLNADLRSRAHENLYALGDCAYLPDVERHPEPSAHRAVHQAGLVARNLMARLKQRQGRTYRDHPNKYLIGLGPEYALASIPSVPLVSGRAPAFMKEATILRHLKSIGGLGLVKEALPNVTLSALKPGRWDGAPLDEGCIVH